MADSHLASLVSNFADSGARNVTAYGSADCLSQRVLVCPQMAIFFSTLNFRRARE